MKRTVRMNDMEFGIFQSFKENLKISGFALQNIDDKDVTNLFIHYFSEKDRTAKEISLQKSFRNANPKNAIGSFPLYKTLEDIGIFDFLSDKMENRILILDETSEDAIKKIHESHPERSLTSIIKNIIFIVLYNPLDVVDLMVKYLFSQALLLVPFENRKNKESLEQAKKDYIDGKMPSLNINKSDIDNYYSIFEKIKSFKSFKVVLEQAQISQMGHAKILKLVNNSMLAHSNIHYKKDNTSSVTYVNTISSKLLSIALPAMIALKLISITLIYSTMKKSNLYMPISSTIDNIAENIAENSFIENIANIKLRIDEISKDFDEISPIILKENDNWEKHVKQLNKDK